MNSSTRAHALSDCATACPPHSMEITRDCRTRSIIRVCTKCGHTEITSLNIVPQSKDSLKFDGCMSSIIKAIMGE